ncbi:MAG: sulfatase [Candidatus Azotimanducaceae bacterium]|uniref:Sulfatase N-terminal domain-containing protein n=1 Tax=OM182 bacterium TaxID=2510334 RepID=A0A520S4I0_9GAMM|nr:MAG: hypothetical protein CBC93_02155 [Gammaproteobacteria bacterium TMED133]RZO77360.1 MAG: hypothetical protein EVA68_01865 [OM182 bacterium]
MPKPNILFLMTDQQRWDTIDAHGDWVRTPNIDGIAKKGTLFSQCITTSPVCVPARLTLATGQYPHSTGIWTHQEYTMPATAQNWMREIQKQGYRTSLFGKTHLHPHIGDLREQETLLHSWGLDDVDEIGGPRASAHVMSHMTASWKRKGLLENYKTDIKTRFANKPYIVRPSPLPLQDYYDVYVGQRAKEYLKAYNCNKPWFCWVSFGGPHEPWDTPEPYASMYDPSSMPLAISKRSIKKNVRPKGFLDEITNGKWSPDFKAGEVNAMRANYAGNVTLIDDQIGEILEAIEDRGEIDNTIIAFTSDHGEMNGDHGLIYKMNFLDGSVRVPLIIKAPGFEEGLTNNSLVENSDLGPTLLQLVGRDIGYNQFAKSLVDAMDGSNHREDGLSEIVGEFMLMNDEWKIALNRDGLTYLLFDRKNDPQELVNLTGDLGYRSKEVALRHRILERLIQSQNLLN